MLKLLNTSLLIALVVCGSAAADSADSDRLAPSLATSRDDPELRARLEAIGESNRMTLRFRKPE